MAKKQGLGRGLGNIFAESEKAEEGNILSLRISSVEPRPGQPRKEFDGEALAQLADSIGEHGVIQPIIVRDAGEGYYEIIAGERRWRASKLAGLTEIPAIVVEADDKKAAELALIENIQREELNPYEEAQAYSELIESFGMTQEALAARLGKSRSAITNALRLLDLPEEVSIYLKSGELSAGHARALLGLKDKSKLKALSEKIIGRRLSVRETEAAVKRENKLSSYEPENIVSTVNVDYIGELARKAEELTGRRVRITTSGKKRSVVVDYTDYEDLEQLLIKLCGNGIIE